MNMPRLSLILFAGFVFLAGCTSVQTAREWTRVSDTVTTITGQTMIWEQSEEDRSQVPAKIDTLFADGLSRDEVVRIAIINNRKLQSTFEDIGISKAELVQAGLFSNPDLAASFKFPQEGSTKIEADLFFNLADMWQISHRRDAADRQMLITILEVGQKVLDTAAEAKIAYDRVLFFRKGMAETEDIVENLKSIRDETTIRRSFGFLTDADVYAATIMVARAEIELAHMKRDLAAAEAHLQRVMGLTSMGRHITMPDALPSEAHEQPDLEFAVKYALAHRLDVQAARQRIEFAKEAAALEQVGVMKHVRLGLTYEREPDGDDLIGPALEIEAPFFDQNRAMISASHYRIRQARKDLEFLEGRVREELTKDIETLHAAALTIRHYEETIIPLGTKTVEYAQKWVNAMQMNALHLLEAQKGLLESRREYLESLIDYRRALVTMELHLGGRIPWKH